MIRRLFICTAVLGCIGLVWPWAVRAQGCRVIHSENLGTPDTVPLMPSDVAAQGGTAVTLTVSAIDGTQVSHNMTVGYGTKLSLNIASYNTGSSQSESVGLEVYFSIDGGTKQSWWTPQSANTSWVIGSESESPGHTLDVYLAGLRKSDSGTTQDVIHIMVTNQSPGIYFTDDFPTNYYEELKNNFNGTTSMNFEYCPGAATATHTAPFFGTLTNPTSGETASFNTSLAFRPNGGYNEEVPPTYVSFLPGDKPPQTSTTGRVMCTIAGDFVGLIAATGDSTKNQRVDKKMWTKVKIATTVQASDGGWYTENWCADREIPIWSPNELYTSLAPLNQYYWTAQTCSSSPPGTDPGPGWHCPAISGGPGPGNPQQFFPSLTSTRGGCNTNANTPAPY